MSVRKNQQLENRFNALMMILAPLIFSLSTFFWKDGEYGTVGGTLISISSVCWIPVIYSLFGLIKEGSPLYYYIGLVYAIYGCRIGGTEFGYLGFFTYAFHISHDTYISQLAVYPLSSNLLLF